MNFDFEICAMCWVGTEFWTKVSLVAVHHESFKDITSHNTEQPKSKGMWSLPPTFLDHLNLVLRVSKTNGIQPFNNQPLQAFSIRTSTPRIIDG
jgi:hypothetical protein